MIYELGMTIFFIVCILLIIVVLMQKSHGGFFAGPANNDSTIVFGGSGGSEAFQKVTWVLGFLLITLTFSLSLYKSKIAKTSKYAVAAKLNNTENTNTEDNNAADNTDIPANNDLVPEETSATTETKA